jgi:hypothetical protein
MTRGQRLLTKFIGSAIEREGKPVQIPGVPPCCLSISLSLSLSLSSINTCELYKLTLSDQAQATGVHISDLVYRFLAGPPLLECPYFFFFFFTGRKHARGGPQWTQKNFSLTAVPIWNGTSPSHRAPLRNATVSSHILR